MAADRLQRRLWLQAACGSRAAGAEGAYGVRAMTTVSDTASTAWSITVRSQAGGTGLAGTGAFDTAPYIVGGTAFLGAGAACVAYWVRRERVGLQGRPSGLRGTPLTVCAGHLIVRR
ncbi:hypothetical protein ABT026_18130 [Streptomyces sp. NPDC002734]|uniref:hypothetical protein n=1 Tax=Streptomyces sp. NPDC002734 TaxID=3154426 RepID=UPI003333CFDE